MNTDRRGFLGLTIGVLVGARLVAPEIARAAKPRVGSSTAVEYTRTADQILECSAPEDGPSKTLYNLDTGRVEPNPAYYKLHLTSFTGSRSTIAGSAESLAFDFPPLVL